MSGHTPGPWSAIHVTGNGGLGAYDHHEIRASVALVMTNYDRTNPNRNADMILAAAAPDLLASLEECLPCLGWESDSLEELQREHELGNGYAELIIRARSAIARAKGEA